MVTKIRLLEIILLLCSACEPALQPAITPSPQPLTLQTDQLPTATTLLNNPEPVVNFIDYLEPYPGQRGNIIQLICIQIRPDVIYEPGDVATYGPNSTRFQLFVDGIELPFAQANPMERGFNPKYDPVANMDYYEGSQAGCLPVSINPGLHLAKISAVSSSGKTYLYMWAFRADTVGATASEPHEKWLGSFDATVEARVANKQFNDPYAVRLATQMAKQPNPTPLSTLTMVPATITP